MLRAHQAHRLRFVLCASAILFTLSKPASAETLVAPRWDVWVVDESGKPVAGISVTQVREDYACESVDHTETLFTDSHGHVQFHARYLKWNPLKCGVFTTAELFKRTHGRHASVIAGDPNGILFGKPVDKNANEIGDWRGSPDHVTSHIILRRRVVPLTPPKK